MKENTLKENKVLSNAGLLFEIILEDIGWRNLTVPKLLMEFTGLKLEEVEKLISKTPCTILKSLGEEQAVNIKLKLEAKGAKVSLKQCQLKN